MNPRIIATFAKLGLVWSVNRLVNEMVLRHDLRKKYLHEKDFETIYKIRNFKNKTRYDFANDEFREFEPLGEISK